MEILSAVLSDGLAAVEAACAEALAGGVHSADVVLNILARRRDPGRQRRLRHPRCCPCDTHPSPIVPATIACAGLPDGAC